MSVARKRTPRSVQIGPIVMPLELANEVERLAAEQDRSVANVVRRALKEHLASQNEIDRPGQSGRSKTVARHATHAEA